MNSIASRYGVHETTVNNALKRAGVRLHSRLFTGKFRKARLLREKTSEIIDRYKNGESGNVIADLLGTNPVTIRNILRENCVTLRTSAEGKKARLRLGIKWKRRSVFSRENGRWVNKCSDCGTVRYPKRMRTVSAKSLCRKCGAKKALSKRQTMIDSGEFGKRISAGAQRVSLSEWKGYVTEWWDAFRLSDKFAPFVQAIYKRDLYRCVQCGKKKTRRLRFTVHHIERKADNRERAFDIDNCVSLCRQCHYKVTGHEPIYAIGFTAYVEWRQKHPTTVLDPRKFLRLVDPVRLQMIDAQLSGDAPEEPVIPGQAS